MGALADIGSTKFVAAEVFPSTLPITLISTNGGVSYSTLFEPGAGTANNVVASNGKVILYGNFGTDFNIVDWDNGNLIDISIVGLGPTTTINGLAYNSTDDTFFATIDGLQDLYKRTAGVWAPVNPGVGINAAQVLGLFGTLNQVLFCGVDVGVAKFLISLTDGISIVDKTGIMTGDSAIAMGVAINTTVS